MSRSHVNVVLLRKRESYLAPWPFFVLCFSIMIFVVLPRLDILDVFKLLIGFGVSVFLLTQWLGDFKCFLHYTKVKDVHLADACKVTTFAQMLGFNTLGSLTEEIYFDLQRQRFIYSHEKEAFYKLPYPTKETFGYYLSRTGYDCDAQVQIDADNWGRNVIKVMTRSSSKSKKQIDWLDLPSDVMVNILSRITVAEILWNVQIVCNKWHEICKDPYMWRVIYMDEDFYSNHKPYTWPSCLPDSIRSSEQMCKMVVERSHGQLVDITIVECCDDELLQYVVDRSSQLRRLAIAYSYNKISDEGLTTALKKLPLLEEISVHNTHFSQKFIEALGSYCHLLKRLKLRNTENTPGDELPEVIVQSLPQLRHLELNWLHLSDNGLRAILDGCRHLQLLDLRMCEPVKLKGELSKRCLEQIKCVKLPTDPIKFSPYSDSDDVVDLVSFYRDWVWEYEDDGTED